MARVAAVARRSHPAGTPESPSDGLLVDTGAKRAFHFGQELELTRSELLLAAALARRPMCTFSRSELLEQIRGDDAEVTERAVDVHVANLRRKLDDAAAASGCKTINPVETVWGLGYRWRKEVTGIVRG
jgi:two-component system response regulator BaeR